MKIHSAYISEICKLLDVDFIGEDILIDSLNLANRGSQYQSILSYMTNVDFCKIVANNKKVVAVIVPKIYYEAIKDFMENADRKLVYVLADNAEYMFYDLHNALYKCSSFYDKFEEKAIIGENCDIAPSAVIESGVQIGNNVSIGPNSVVRRGSIIEDDVTIGCCSVIGSEGFQAIRGYRQKIRHVGRCHLCRGVNVGDNTDVCNALFEGETTIGEYSNIDNLVHIAHNCKVGKYCVITDHCTMMGSTELEDNVWLAPNAVILNGCKVESDAFVGTLAYVNKNVSAGKTVVGIPAKELVKNK